MPQDMEFTLRVRVDDDEQARRIMDAVMSGLASEILRIGVLYGQIPVGGVAGVATPPSNSAVNAARQEAKQREASIELKRVEDKVGRVLDKTEEVPPVKQPTGLVGRKRLGRS